MNLRLAWLALAFGCASGGPTVIVDVVTDYSPGTEFHSVRTQIIDGPMLVTPAAESQSEQFLRARRIATFDSDLSAGEITVRVELLRQDGSVLATQSRSGTLTNILAVTAVLTRNCEGVRCGSGEVCIDETCVSEACDPTNPSSCPDSLLCQSEGDCVQSGLAACARASCIQLLCLVETDDSICDASLRCNAVFGCIPPPSSGQPDGGVDVDSATDTGCVSGASCETGNPCEVGILNCEGSAPSCVASGEPSDGLSCGEDSFSDWSDCGGFAGTCGNAGERTRNVTQQVCQSGTCTARDNTESEMCTRDTSGVECSPTTCTDFGACGGFSDRCDLGGTESRTCTDRDCAGGSCGSDERDENRSCSRTLSETCGDLIDTDCDGTCDEGCRVAVYRGERGNDHFLTLSRNELTANGYAFNGIAFYVYPNTHPGLIPLFRCLAGSDHFISTSSGCEGTSPDGRLGYALRRNAPSCSSVILYRGFWPGGPDHLATTDSGELGSYNSEPNLAQVWSTP